MKNGKCNRKLYFYKISNLSNVNVVKGEAMQTNRSIQTLTGIIH